MDKPTKKFLGVHYVDCNVYGRLYPNKDNKLYIGRCPKCGISLRVRIGSDGTDSRFFKASCNAIGNRYGY